MRVGMMLNYSGGFTETVSELADFERAGLEIVFVPEAYSFDAVSQLGFIAAKTTALEIASGILPIYSRTPALTAMTAAGLDYVSGGRFTLGLGTSGPQVIEGWHGVPYDAPVGRTRELIEICRAVWRRERLDHHTKLYDIPLTPRRHRPRQAAQADQPPGPRAHPGRDRRARPEERRARRRARRGLAADLLLPGEGGPHLGRAARRGQRQAGPDAAGARRDRRRAARHRRRRRPGCATSSARCSRSTSAAWARAARTSTTTWPAASATRTRRTRSRTPTWRAARRRPPRLVPAELVEKTSLIGPLGFVKERLAAYREAGVTTLNVTALGASHAQRVKDIETIRDLVG